MQEKTRPSTEGRYRRCLTAVLLCVGYALYSSTAYGGALDVAFVVAMGVDSAGVLLAQVLLVAASGLGCMIARALAARGVDLMRVRVCAACYGIVGVCFGVGCFVAPSTQAICLLSFMAGFVTSVPLLMWFEAFLGVYRVQGPSRCVALIALATLLAHLTGLASSVFVYNSVLAWGAVSVCLVVAGVCQGIYLSQAPMRGLKETEARLPAAGTYRLSVYAAVLVASFGVTAGLSESAAHLGASAPGLTGGWEYLAVAVACGVVAAYAWLGGRKTGVHFGQLIRLSLVFSGVAFAFAPLLSLYMPPALVPGCGAVHVVAGIAMTLLSIEISHERRLRMVDVMPLNYIVYVVSTCLAMGVPALFPNFAGDAVAWSVVSAIAVTATVAVIPVLPASTSSAATFTLKVLPENESYEVRTARTRESFAVKYGLSTREAEVFELLVQGKTRTQIAECLSLSSWTVKEHIAGVYAKIGVHSAKELMLLVAEG